MSRVFFYVQHLLGLGHLKRAETLAAAMAAAGLDVAVALGGRPVEGVPFAGARTVQLPPATIAGEDFGKLIDGDGQPVDALWKERRGRLLLEAFRAASPDVLLVELYPFGRRQFRFELEPLLEEARAAGRPAACSVRDILVAKPGREAEVVGALRRHFDAVLVHGDPSLIRLDATFGAAAEIADLIRYTGYVAPEFALAEQAAAGASSSGKRSATRGPRAASPWVLGSSPTVTGEEFPGAIHPSAADRVPTGEVIVSAGGGAVGATLLETALAARRLTRFRDATWRVVTGPNMPEPARSRLTAAAGDRTIVETFRPDFPRLLAAAALSISQAGYNTTMDILRAGIRAVVVPYEAPGETEQRLRSDLLAASGLLTVLPEGELSAPALARAIETAAERQNAARLPAIDLDGARRTAALVVELAKGRLRVTQASDR